MHTRTRTAGQKHKKKTSKAVGEHGRDKSGKKEQRENGPTVFGEGAPHEALSGLVWQLVAAAAHTGFSSVYGGWDEVVSVWGNNTAVWG